MKTQAMPINPQRLAREDSLLRNIASVATAIEALEMLLIDRGVLKNDELMAKITEIVNQKAAGGNQLAADDD